jgi:lipoprotein-releasing system permease protein
VKGLDFCIKIIKIECMKQKNRSITWLAKRYLSGQSSFLINKSHFLTLIGLTLGVTGLLCVSSVMNGLRTDIQARITGTLSEIKISKPEGAPFSDYDIMIEKLNQEGFLAAPVVRNELVIIKEGKIYPTLSLGIDPEKHSEISAAVQPKAIDNSSGVQGLLTGNIQNKEFIDGGIALGLGLAASLNIGIGDKIELLSPVFNIPSAFGMLPRVRTLKVAAIFTTGMPEYDETYSFIPLTVAQYFSGYTNQIDYLEVKTDIFSNPKSATRKIKSLFPDFEVEDWSAYDPSLYSSIRFEKNLMFLIMLFMYIIASFNLIGNLWKTITRKKKELGLLKAFGYSEKELRTLFLYQALFLATLGIVLGLIIATILLLLQQRFGIISMDLGTAGSSALPVKFAATDYLMVIIFSYLVTFISVILPLRNLKNINPVELIRQTA